MGKIFYILGKSSSGKDTIFQQIKNNRQLNLKTVVGYTTRPMRVGEKNGVEYYFVSPQKLEEMKDKGKIIECRGYNTVHGLWNYFTADDGQIDLDSDNNYLYIGTLEAYKGMRKYYGEENVIPFYIYVEPGERLSRAVERERRQENPKYTEEPKGVTSPKHRGIALRIISLGMTRNVFSGARDQNQENFTSIYH